MTTRRRFLAGLGTGAIGAVAGCGALDEFGEQSNDRLNEEDLGTWTPENLVQPSSLHFALPASVFDAQADRAKSLLDAVPADPAIPNATIDATIRDDRSHIHDQIEGDINTDTDLERLETWRRYRTEASELFGSYRAATGNDDSSIIANRREQVRDSLATIESEIEYSAASTLEAVLVYAPVEARLDQAKRDIPPRDPYPENPSANVEQAGRAFRGIESAAAAVEAATDIRNAYESTVSSIQTQWSELATAQRRLEISIGRTRSSRVPNPETTDAAEVFEFELSGVERELFRFARRDTQYTIESLQNAGETNRFATAVVMTGRSLSSIAAFDASITAIRNDDLPDEQSVASIQTAAENAHETLREIPMGEYPFLSAAIGKPAVLEYHSGVRSAGEELFDPEYAEASFRYAALLGAATNEAAAFVVDQLDGHP